MILSGTVSSPVPFLGVSKAFPSKLYFTLLWRVTVFLFGQFLLLKLLEAGSDCLDKGAGYILVGLVILGLSRGYCSIQDYFVGS